jgi:hypothetical protein
MKCHCHHSHLFPKCEVPFFMNHRGPTALNFLQQEGQRIPSILSYQDRHFSSLHTSALPPVMRKLLSFYPPLPWGAISAVGS